MASSRSQILPRNYGFLVRVFVGRDAVTGKRVYENEQVRSSKKKDAEKVLTAILRKLDSGELLLEQNVNPKIVSERLGHASVSLTLDTYSHILPTIQNAAVEALGASLYKTLGQPAPVPLNWLVHVRHMKLRKRSQDESGFA